MDEKGAENKKNAKKKPHKDVGTARGENSPKVNSR